MNTPARRWAARCALLILPVLFAQTALWLACDRGPLWLGNNSDPSYQYLLNSLLILNGLPPCHIDHPGTTVQTLGSVVLSLTTPGRNLNEQTLAILSDPERALSQLHFFFLIASAAAVAVAGLLALERTGSTMIGWTLQLVPLLQVGTYRATLFVAPEALLVPLTLLLMALLITHEFNLKSSTSPRQEMMINVFLGLVAAAGLVTKITFAPLCLLPLLVQRSWRGIASIGGVMIIGAALYLVPIYSQIPRMLQWFSDLATHQGIYGTGDMGFVDLAAYPKNVLELILTDCSLPIVMITAWGAAGISLACRSQSRHQRRLVRLLFMVTAVQVVGVLLVAKHPRPHYLLPVTMLSALDLALLIPIVRAWPWQKHRCVLLAGAGVMIAAAGGFVIADIAKFNRELRNARDTRVRETRDAAEWTSDGIRIDYYRSSSLPFALYFGNGSAWRIFGKPLEQLHPRRVFYNIFTGTFESFSRRLSPAEVFGTQKIYLVGDGSIDHVLPGPSLPPGWKMTLVERGNETSIHLLQKAD